MIDPDATPGEGLDAIRKEADTRPDLRTFPCPYCVGDDGKPTGMVLDVTEWKTGHKAHAKKCSRCQGARIVTREQMASFQATRHGRPR